MSVPQFIITSRGDSPDPASRSPNIYDEEAEWQDQDDDMDYEQSTDHEESEIEFFEAGEGDDDGDFHGMAPTVTKLDILLKTLILSMATRRRRRS